MSDCQNLGPNEIKKRRIVGTVGLVSYFGTLYYFATHQVPTLYQFLIFVPYLITIVGFYQAEEKTCLAIAVQGKENYDNGNLCFHCFFNGHLLNYILRK